MTALKGALRQNRGGCHALRTRICMCLRSGCDFTAWMRDDVYRAASQFGFGIAILGNPTPLDRVRQLLEIDRPLYFQVSLEGLEAHNDAIRGKGHFARSLAFLEGLRDLDIFSMVKVTWPRTCVRRQKS